MIVGRHWMPSVGADNGTKANRDGVNPKVGRQRPHDSDVAEQTSD